MFGKWILIVIRKWTELISEVREMNTIIQENIA